MTMSTYSLAEALALRSFDVPIQPILLAIAIVLGEGRSLITMIANWALLSVPRKDEDQ